MSNVTPMIELSGVSKSFGSTRVVKDVHLKVEKGDIIAIIGPSGAGKSTLLRIVNQLEHHDAGTLRVEGQAIDPRSGAAALAALRSKVGMVFQSFNLWNHLSALQNVAEGPRTVLRLPRAEAEQQALEYLDRVGLGGFAAKYPGQLSGGQQQRVAIARALAMRPHVMLFDEATSALDPALVGEVLAVIRQLAAENMTMLVVTHELHFAREVADRIVFMADGEILEEAPAKDFFNSPKHPRSRDFLSKVLS